MAKNPPAKAGRCKRRGINPWIGTIPWRRKRQPTPVFLPGRFHGEWSPVGYCPWGHKESDTPEHICTLICSLDVISNISQNPKE